MLDVWREACRHIDIAESVERIAGLVGRQVPADRIVVRRLDAERQCIETVADGACRAGTPRSSEESRSACTPALFQAVLGWCAEGRLLRARMEVVAPLVSVIVPAGVTGEVIVGPLVTAGTPMGVLLFVGASGAFGEDDDAVLREMLEPMAVALANDSRIHELARLREALEADRQALLSRLERHDIADTVVGVETGLRWVMERVQQVARTDAPVLIIGETGTGKEVIARAIHERSRRHDGPVVRVNCGAIPPGLVDSELFGHERGSFTGAVSARKGWFERADGGTLFLDEVGELPGEAQVRLLRILHDGTFDRVGAQKTQRVDVRVIAATNRDLEAMVAEGRFREDLWYRIGIFPIRLPALRERAEDIPTLAAHFAWRAGKRLGGAPLAPTASDVDLLLSYPWPGNVRELAAVIERAAILGDGRRLEVAAALGAARPAIPVSRTVPTTPDRDGSIETLNDAMARHIERALAATRGRIEGATGAAKLLGINPHTLRARMRKLGIDWARYREPVSTR